MVEKLGLGNAVWQVCLTSVSVCSNDNFRNKWIFDQVIGEAIQLDLLQGKLIDRGQSSRSSKENVPFCLRQE